MDVDGAVREEQELKVVGAGGVGRGLCGYEEYGAEPASAVMDAVFLKAQSGYRGGGSKRLLPLLPITPHLQLFKAT